MPKSKGKSEITSTSQSDAGSKKEKKGVRNRPSASRWDFSGTSGSQDQTRVSNTSHGSGWDSTVFDSPQIDATEESEAFLKAIEQIKGKTIKEIVALIPADAAGEIASDTSSESEWQGFAFSWRDQQKEQWRIRAHSPKYAEHIPESNNSLQGWTIRVERGGNFMDSSGNFHLRRKALPGGVEEIINDTHIPITVLEPYICPVTKPAQYQDTAWGAEQMQRIARILNREKLGWKS